MLLVILINNEHIHTYIIVFLQSLFACAFVYSICVTPLLIMSILLYICVEKYLHCLHAYIAQLFPYYIIDHIVWITMTTKFVFGQ